ncbi:MAG: hypothetical protein QG557_721 [Pseudomonadota bacterium]|nr:hypothetical protein [Pseudomonadota bacterium]
MKDNHNKESPSNVVAFLIKVTYVALAIAIWMLFQSLIGVPMKMV